MAFFPDVAPGQEFKPSALLSNNVRRLVNAANGYYTKPLRGIGGGPIRIQVRNNSGKEIAAGSAVNFCDGADLSGGALPVEPFKKDAAVWGVLPEKLAPAQCGDCIIAGPVTVAATGTGDYAMPSKTNPALFERGDDGAPVFFASADKVMLLLGFGGDEAATGYDGPLAVKLDEGGNLSVKAGYLLRNGEMVAVPASSVKPEKGTLCIECKLEKSGWGAVSAKFTSPAPDAFPIAEVAVDEKTKAVSVQQCGFGTAIIMVTKICPMAEF